MSEFNKFSRLKNSATLKVIVIVIMIIMMMIPNFMIQDLIRERSNRKVVIENEVAQSYGKNQNIMVPILKVPYTEAFYNQDKGTTTINKSTLNFSPFSTKVNGEIETDTRKRSIFEVVVYESDMTIEQIFNLSNLDLTAYEAYDIDYENAYLVIGMTDTNGLSEDISISVDGNNIKTTGVIANPHTHMSWVATERFPIDITKEFAVTSDIALKGTKSLMLHPIGENYIAELHSSWSDPSFTGVKLPSAYDITEEGFQSKWVTNKFAHDIPKHWSSLVMNLNPKGFGVNFIQPLDEYGKNTRTAKYALLIISLTFGIFFLFEILQKKNIHPIQYILVGFALTIFFLLLLSITEHLGFDLAYLLSSLATICLIISYTSSILKNRNSTMMLGALLVGLFGYVFIILQMMDYALLAGALALFAVLAAVMLVSRNVDWYRVSRSTEELLNRDLYNPGV